MLKNYVKIALRNLAKNKIYAAINVSGLAIGISSFLLIMLYIQFDFSYDTFHRNSNNLYRLIEDVNFGGSFQKIAITSAPAAPFLAENAHEITDYVRFRKQSSSSLISYNEKKFYEERFFYADASVFTVFDFVLVAGDRSTVLAEPNTIVITERIAKKYFGNESPLGKSLLLDNQRAFAVTGVMKEIPQNSHIKFDFLASFITLRNIYEGMDQDYGSHLYQSYIQLAEKSDPSEVETKFAEAVRIKQGDDEASSIRYLLQPMESIHFTTDLRFDRAETADKMYNYLFGAIGIFIMALACINYMNLTTAKADVRLKEIGVRKVVGAQRKHLIYQYMLESSVLVFGALLFSGILIQYSTNYFFAHFGKDLGTMLFSDMSLLPGVFAFILIVGLVAGSYPALYLSSFRPVDVLKGITKRSRENHLLRKSLVVFQFAISVGMIIGALVLEGQMDYLKNKRLGFDKEQIVKIPLSNVSQDFVVQMKEELGQSTLIKAAGLSTGLPGAGVNGQAFLPEGYQRTETFLWSSINVDYDFLELLGISFVEGRNFSESFGNDEDNAFILNQAALRELGWESAVGKEFRWASIIGNGGAQAFGKEGRVIGVVNDFHVTSLHSTIAPLVIQVGSSNYSYLTAKLANENVAGSIEHLENSWNKFYSSYPFQFSFLDEDFDNLYRSEEQISLLFKVFTFIGIYLASIGLIALASFNARRRLKEISVRKVLGASVYKIGGMFAREFLGIAALSIVIALPVTYFVMNNWLENFAYRISIDLSIYLYTSLAAILLLLTTVGYQSLRASLANPVKALKQD